MSKTLSLILSETMEHLRSQATTFLPSLLAACIMILGALVVAVTARRVVYRVFKFAGIDRFMRRTGIAHLIDPTGRLRTTRLAAESLYWSILLTGVLSGLSVFGTDLTAQLIQKFVFLLPRLAIAGAILLAGAWLSQYLGRSVLVWAFNEKFPHPRRFATGVRVMVLFVAVVVATDYLDFGRTIFLTAFIIFMGGLVLTVSLAVGIGAAGRVRGFLSEKLEHETSDNERSLWTHL